MYFNLGWTDYFSMVLMLTAWVLGFFSITRKGKLLHFILAFFEKGKTIKVDCEAKANENYDLEIKQLFPNGWQGSIATSIGADALNRIITNYLEGKKIKTGKGLYLVKERDTVLYNLTQGNTNQYQVDSIKPTFPDIIKDPIVVCITCMPSVHGMLLYTTMCLYKHWQWNPLEWALIAIPVAFTGTFLWKLLTLIEKTISKIS